MAVKVETMLAFEPPTGAMSAREAIDDLAGQAAPPVHQDFGVEYFDTSDGALAALGIVLVRHQGGDADGWHLKLPEPSGPGGSDVSPARRRITTNPPKTLRDAVSGLAGNRPVKSVASLRVHRRASALLDSDAAVIGEIRDDTMEVAASASGDDQSWRHWELVLHDGSTKILKASTAGLTDAGARELPYSAGLERILGVSAAGHAAQPTLDKHQAAWLAVHRRLADLVVTVKVLDPRVRLDLPESVHDMRVAMRRLRSTLATFRPLVDRDVTDPLREEVRWLARLLGEARDSEVLREYLRDRLIGVPDDLVLGPVGQRVDHELGVRYREAHDRTLEAMRSDRYLVLLEHLDALVANPPWTDAALEEADKRLPSRVDHDWQRVRRAVKAVSSDDPQHRDEQLHEVRKAAKRARYAAETLEPLYGRDADAFATANKRVQSVLGDHNDSVVARRELLTLAKRAADEGEPSFTYGLLHRGEEAAAAVLRERFERLWHKASRPKLRRWLH